MLEHTCMYADVVTQALIPVKVEEPCVGSDNEWDFCDVDEHYTCAASERWRIVWDESRRVYEFVDTASMQIAETRKSSLNGKTYTVQFGEESRHKLIISRMFPEVPVFVYDYEDAFGDCGLNDDDDVQTPPEEQGLAQPLQEQDVRQPCGACFQPKSEPVTVEAACQTHQGYGDSSQDEDCYPGDSCEEGIPSDNDQDWDCKSRSVLGHDFYPLFDICHTTRKTALSNQACTGKHAREGVFQIGLRVRLICRFCQNDALKTLTR